MRTREGVLLGGQQTQKCLGIRMGDVITQFRASQSEWTPCHLLCHPAPLNTSWYLRNFPPYELPSPTVEVRYFQSQIVSKRPQWSSPPCCPFLAMWPCWSSHQELESISQPLSLGISGAFGGLEPVPQEALYFSQSPAWNSCCPGRNLGWASVQDERPDRRKRCPANKTNQQSRDISYHSLSRLELNGLDGTITWVDNRLEQFLKTVQLNPAQSASYTIMSKEK